MTTNTTYQYDNKIVDNEVVLSKFKNYLSNGKVTQRYTYGS